MVLDVQDNMIPESVRAAAERLRSAALNGVVTSPVRDLIGRDDVAAAYAVQRLLGEERLAAGVTVVGHKIGLTSHAVQQQLGVRQPDFGVLYSDMGYDDGAEIPFSRLLQPRVEAEVAFALKADLAEGELELDQVVDAIDYAMSALEICDSRVAGWDITFGDTVADNASAGLYVVGTERRTLDEVVPHDVKMTMTVTGAEDCTGNGAACLGDPLLAVQWLARRSRELGTPLRAGEVILSGALGPMRPVIPGAVAHATISGLGTVSVRFSKETE
jgi:2-keto-4-pentenoate hydratase